MEIIASQTRFLEKPNDRIVYLGSYKHFDIIYTINPWMNARNPIRRHLVERQWNNIVKKFQSENINYQIIDVVPHPDAVFVADSGIIVNNKFIRSNFKHKERQPEQRYWESFFLKRKYQIITLPDSITFEGTGDLLIGEEQAFIGYGVRTNREAIHHIQPHICHTVVPIELVSKRFFHLDTCFFPVDKKNVLLFSKAVSKESLSRLSEKCNVIEIPEEEASNFSLNLFKYNNTIFMNKGNPITYGILKNFGFDLVELELDEFIKGGGSIKCMVLQEAKL